MGDGIGKEEGNERVCGDLPGGTMGNGRWGYFWVIRVDKIPLKKSFK